MGAYEQLVNVSINLRTTFVGAAGFLHRSPFGRTATFPPLAGRDKSRFQYFKTLVGAAGFEPATSCSQSRRDEPGYATPREITICLKNLYSGTLFNGEAPLKQTKLQTIPHSKFKYRF